MRASRTGGKSVKTTIYSSKLAWLVISLLLFAPAISHAQSVFMLQLGSHGSEEEAGEKWNDLKGKFPDTLGKLSLRISQVALPPDNFVVFRTQAGPIKNREEANKMCSAVLASSQECFVVETAMFVTPEKAFAEAPTAPAPDTTPAPKITGSTPAKDAPAPPVKMAEEKPAPAPTPVAAPAPPPAPKEVAAAKPAPEEKKQAKEAKKELPWEADKQQSLAAPTEAKLTTPPVPTKAMPAPMEAKNDKPAPKPPVQVAAAPPPPPPPPPEAFAPPPPPPVQKAEAAKLAERPLPAPSALGVEDVPTPPPPPPVQKVEAPKDAEAPVPTVSVRKANSLTAPMQLAKTVVKSPQTEAPAAPLRIAAPPPPPPTPAPPPPAPPRMMAAAAPPPPPPSPATAAPAAAAPSVIIGGTPQQPMIVSAPPPPAPTPIRATQMVDTRMMATPGPVAAEPPLAPPANVMVRPEQPSIRPQLQETPSSQPGRVEVAEAVRVPLSVSATNAARSGISATPPATMAAPKAAGRVRPFFGYGGFPSQSFSKQTTWAQLGYFPDDQTAYTYWDKVRETYPDITGALRVRVTKPYTTAQRNGSSRVSLRVGPFPSQADMETICKVTRQASLDCTSLREMGNSTGAYAERTRGGDRYLSDRYKGRESRDRDPFQNISYEEIYWAQLGSYPSPQRASEAWENLKGSYGFAFGGMEPNVITPAMSSSARPVFRLRTGPFNTNLAAANMCNSLQKFGISCLVVAEQ